MELAHCLIRYAKGPNNEDHIIDCTQTDIDDFLGKNGLEKSTWTYNLDSCELLRVILNDLQNASIQYSSNKKRIQEENIQTKKTRYAWLMKLKTSNVTFTAEMQENLEEAEREYKDLVNGIAEQNILHDRIKHR